MDDLQRKAKAVCESLVFSARHILLNSDLRSANRLVESFQKERGCRDALSMIKTGTSWQLPKGFQIGSKKRSPILMTYWLIKNRGRL